MDEKEERKIILDLPWFGNSAYIHRSLFSSIIGHPLYERVETFIQSYRLHEKKGKRREYKVN